MRKWHISSYTRAIESESNELLLHNSFMGSIARIPLHESQTIKRYLSCEIEESDLINTTLKDLCEAGFFVPSDIDERKIVDETIRQEKEASFSIIILPHENCNFRCVYCYEKFERGRMEQDVINGLKLLVDNKVQKVKHISIAWFGGEPLLARDIIYDLSDSFLESCKRNAVSYSGGITTNGYLLTCDVVDALLKRRVTSYQVTLDGTEETHNQSRKLAGGGETYQKILDNLVGMQCRDENFSVKIRVNFSKDHTPSVMEEFLDKMRLTFAGDSRFNLNFHPVGKWGGSNDSELNVCDANSAGFVRSELFKKSLQLGFSDAPIKRSLQSHGNVCYAGRETSIVVGTNGTIYKCTVAFDDLRNHVGKITRDGDMVIDQAKWDLWTKLEDKDTGKCGSCSFSPTCQSRGCPLVAINNKEPPCPMTKEEYESRVKLVALNAAI